MLTQNALPDAALVDRFGDQFARLSNAGHGDRIGVAVSGGADSVALLLLATAAFSGRVEAATVDHRLRTASTDEAVFVAGICTTRGILHETLTLGMLPDGNVSAQAREARYAALQIWANRRKIDWLLTGHHADDQLETMIMRINRSAGVAGLSGVRARNGRIVRPLLGWRRAELRQIVADAGIVPIDDPSNGDDRYDRARLRKALAHVDWIDPFAATRSAALLADADSALDWSVDRLEAERVRLEGKLLTLDPANLPAEYCRRITLRCIRRIDPDCCPRGEALTRTIATLYIGGTTTIGNVLCRGGELWLFTPAPPRRGST